MDHHWTSSRYGNFQKKILPLNKFSITSRFILEININHSFHSFFFQLQIVSVGNMAEHYCSRSLQWRLKKLLCQLSKTTLHGSLFVEPNVETILPKIWFLKYQRRTILPHIPLPPSQQYLIYPNTDFHCYFFTFYKLAAHLYLGFYSDWCGPKPQCTCYGPTGFISTSNLGKKWIQTKLDSTCIMFLRK